MFSHPSQPHYHLCLCGFVAPHSSLYHRSSTFMYMCVCMCERETVWPRHLSLHQLASEPTTSQLSLSALHTHIHTYSGNIRWPSHSPDVSYTALQGSPDDMHGLSCGILGLQAKSGLALRAALYFWLKSGRVRFKQYLSCKSDVFTGSDAKLRRQYMHTYKGLKCRMFYGSCGALVIIKMNNSISHCRHKTALFTLKWQSPGAAVVIIKGAQEESASPRREEVRLDSWVNKTSDFNMGDCVCVLLVDRDHSLILTIWLFL